MSPFDPIQIVVSSLTNFTVNTLGPNWVEKHKLDKELRKFIEGETDRFSKYTNAMIERYSNIKTIVFGTQSRKLEELYIPLTISKGMNDTFYEFTDHGDYLVDEITRKELFQIKDYDDNFIPNFKKVLLIDSAGMGKSTLMKWLYLSCIKKNKAFPIFIELKNLNGDKSIFDEICSELSSTFKTDEFNILIDTLIKKNSPYPWVGVNVGVLG